MTDQDCLTRLKHLTEHILPQRASSERWPLRLDHCFKRICFDAAFRGPWYRHIARPAERHLAGEPLRRALACAENLLAGGREVLDQRNRESLLWRGKLRTATATTAERQTPE